MQGRISLRIDGGVADIDIVETAPTISMLTMERKRASLSEDIADYAKDGRLTEPSDGKRYEWRKMIDAVKALGRPLTDVEAEQYRVK